MQAWPAIILLWLLYIGGSQSDEEDPLQHLAQVAAKERQLTDVLKLLHKATEKDEEEVEDENNKKTEPCKHKVLELKITKGQVHIFKEGKKSALRLSNLLNNLFLATPSHKGISVTYPSNVFYALVRAALEGEHSLVSIGIAFLRGEFKSTFDSSEDTKHGELFGAYAFKQKSRVLVRDLAALYNNSYDHSDVEGTQWFTHLTYRFVIRKF